MAKRELRAWTPQDSAELYQTKSWGAGYFNINNQGHAVAIAPDRNDREIDLLGLVKQLERRGYKPPLLLRFSDILRHRVRTLCESFQNAITEYGYRGKYRSVYPIKVNQQRQVVEELIKYGRPYGLGLEAGSKPELLVALAILDTPDAYIVCNGYKDLEYIEIALLAQKLGRQPILVVDRFDELDLIVEASKRFHMKPRIGLRARLAARGAGKWNESTGDRSKFGLSATELVEAMQVLQRQDMLDCLQLLHFHMGSQITAIRAIKGALRECARIFVEMREMGAPLRYIDVGGGLAVDYDGSQTNFHSSANYSLQEYANDVVAAIQEACDERGMDHPVILSESGRAMVAHHSVLVFDVLGVNRVVPDTAPQPAAEDEHEVVRNLWEVLDGITSKNFVEAYHDAIELKEQATSLFNLGYLDLGARARSERLFWATCERIVKIVREMDHIPEEVEGLEKALSDVYYCNFSLFQSCPDHWAVNQLFPIMPIHRLQEQPTRRGTLADLTCDSDGKVDKFIDLKDVKDTLELHPFTERPYYIGMFLLGAYQEILGDLHNLFGDTNAIHVSLDDQHGYRIDSVVEGDSLTEVLGYVQYQRRDLMSWLREATEAAVRSGKLPVEESALLRRRFETELAGYTYLEEDG